MPIYEYLCDACGEQMEKLQRMNDDRLVDCPACGKPALKRLVSAAAFRLKGSGWYETDFKKDNKRNLVDSSSSSGSKDSSGSSPDSSKVSSGSKQGAGSSSSDSKGSTGSDRKKTSKPATKSASD